MKKTDIKNEMITKRLDYSVIQRAAWDKAIHDAVIDRVDSQKIIALYAAFNHEVDTYGIMETLFWSKGHRIVLPRIENKAMNFYEIKSFNDLKKSSYGILEPRGTSVIDPKTIDVMIVPMVAFNRQCYRVGYGGGYYDRYTKDTEFLKIGVAYAFQETEEQFQESHDIPVDVVITDKEVIYDNTK